MTKEIYCCIHAISCITGPQKVRQQKVREFAKQHFSEADYDSKKYLAVFDNSCISTRHFCEPLNLWKKKPTFSQRNDLYIKWSSKLCAKAIEKCLKESRIKAKDISHVVFVSTTGIACPGMLERLIFLIGMDMRVKRIPIWGYACVGGAMGIARAGECAKASPGQWVMLITDELCSLSLLPNDLSRENLVSASLFSDGVTSVLLKAESKSSHHPAIIGTQSVLWKDSMEMMGLNIADNGLKVSLSRHIPDVVEKNIEAEVRLFLGKCGLKQDQIKHFIFHPGGKKILEAFQNGLSLDAHTLRHSWNILKNYGNMSASSVIFVLDEYLKSGEIKKGDLGLMAALGPGLSCELVLLRF
ncbi:type III polyketide synthase [Elusimicrobiota bacterium]